MSTILVIDIHAQDMFRFRERFLVDLVSHGYRVVAAAPDFSPVITDALRVRGVETAGFEIDRSGVNPIREISSILSLTKLMRRISAGVVILYTPKIVIYGAIAGFVSHVPRRYAMITGLGYGFTAKSVKGRVVGLIQRSLYRVCLRLCKCVLFQNPDDMALFVRLRLVGRRTSIGVVNGSGVDIDSFVPEDRPSRLTFLMVGRLLISKGIREYLIAAAELRQDHPEACCKLVGWIDDSNPDSIDETELHNMVEAGGVEFLGRLSDVRPAIAACSVFVLPSRYGEGTPRSILEALSMARAVITTDNPGCRETVVHGRSGFLVKVGESRQIVAAMKRYLRDPNLAVVHGEYGREIAVKKYDVSIVNRSIIEKFGLDSCKAFEVSGERD